ncbi:MAG: hypothetical protein U9O94_08930 [Nanoarchaeota archaeon]|nr:hypothetical protein [Nanoarchaeota archaeon]
MDEISNKTLATLLVVAIVISLAGTFFAMRGVSQITNVITGAQSLAEGGTAQVNITETTEITLTGTLVDFGKGYRNASVVNLDTECNLTTQFTDSDVNGTGCWVADGPFAPAPFTLANTGNNYVNVTINSSTADTFIVDGDAIGGGTARYQFVPSDSSSGPFASSENGCNVTFTVTDWAEFNNAEQLLCTNMSPFSSENEFNVDINVSIPSGPLGAKSTAVTFYGEKSEQ